MPSLLAIESSPRGDYSVSRNLLKTFVTSWKAEHSSDAVVTRDLARTNLPFVDLPWIMGAYTPAEKHSPEMTEALKISNELIAELQAADHIVIATSMYNFSIQAVLKAYIDHIVRAGVTFNAKYEGLLTGKKTTVILASSGEYGPGAYTEAWNHASSYLKFILGFIGLTDVTIVLAGGTSAIDQGKTTLPEFLGKVAPTVETAAAA